jgi:PKD repeat protein
VEDIEAVTTFPTSICQGDSFSLQNNSRGDGISHSWDFDDGNNEGGSEVMHAYENAGTYEISYKVDNANCSSETSGTVSVLESPVAQFDVEGTCVGDTVVFTSRSSVADTNTTYTWSFADGTTSSQPDSVKHAYSSPAIYNTSLDLQNSNGCSDYLVKPVLVSSNPTCGFAVNEGSSATLFELEAEESNYTNYTWLVDSAVIGTGSNLTYDFGQSGTYTVTLNIETQYGCTCSYEENFSIAKTASLKPVIDGISLYPNPSAGVFSIVGKRVNQIRAYNNLGQEVKVLEQTSGVYKLDNSLQNGAYVISVDTEMGTSNHRLILVK